MPDAFQAALVLALVILPGALYTWGIERVVGRWGIGLADRALRFAGISACFQVLFLPLTYHWYRLYIAPGRLVREIHLPLSVWLLLLGYVFVPLIAGLLVGHGMRRRAPWALLIAGSRRAPRAWDEVFFQRGPGIVRLRLKSDGDHDRDSRWLAGWYQTEGEAIASKAAGYPEPQDLYLARRLVCDRRTGELIRWRGLLLDDRDGLLIRWEEVAYLYFRPVENGRMLYEPEAAARKMEGAEGADSP